jgi:hypothetical protein
MEPIEGKRKGSILFQRSGFLYRKDSERAGTIGYRCTSRGCPGRVIQRDGQLRETAHNHEAAADDVELLLLKNRLKRRAEECSGSLREIFDEETAKSTSATQIGFAEVENTMYNRRRRVLPPLPQDAGAAYGALIEAPDRFWSVDGTSVLQGHVRSNDGGIAIFFGHPDMLRRLQNSTTWCMDGTFKTVPGIFYQLLTVGFVELDTFWPALYILLSRKTFAIYQAALYHISTVLCCNASVCSITTDYEIALITAAEAVFPAVDVSGC